MVFSSGELIRIWFWFTRQKDGYYGHQVDADIKDQCIVVTSQGVVNETGDQCTTRATDSLNQRHETHNYPEGREAIELTHNHGQKDYNPTHGKAEDHDINPDHRHALCV